MRAIWKGTISFGLVNIPIAVGLATKRSDPSFRTLDRESMQPVRQQLYAPARDEVVGRDETIKGYEVSKDSYLPISDEELDSVAVQRRRTIDILAFVDAEEVDPVYFDRSYYLEPQENAQKPYALLVQAMKESGKTALGKIVMSSKEYLSLIRPAGDALVIELLFYPEDVRDRDKDEIEEGVRDVQVTEDELAMARQLVDSLSRPFEPEHYENEHKLAVLQLIERKMEGEEVVVAAEAPEPAPVPDLMAALRASIDQAKAGGGGDGADGNGAGEDGGGSGQSKSGGSGAKSGSTAKSGSASKSGGSSKSGSTSSGSKGSRAKSSSSGKSGGGSKSSGSKGKSGAAASNGKGRSTTKSG